MLVVGDEPAVRLLITDVLKELGYTAIEAGDSAAGLRVRESNVCIYFLISDVSLGAYAVPQAVLLLAVRPWRKRLSGNRLRQMDLRFASASQ